MKANETKEGLKDYLKLYKYQPKLTQRLDNIGDKSISKDLINEIVLWKVNRYVDLEEGMLNELNKINMLLMGEHRKSNKLLDQLLKVHGVDLAMASTLLRFRNPKVFQIIDRHAYRAIYGEDFPLHAGTSSNRKTELYFDYIDKLIELCQEKQLEFITVDRLLYMFDKNKNGKL